MHSLHGYSMEIGEDELVNERFANHIDNESLDFANVAQYVCVGVADLGLDLKIGQEALAYALSVGCRTVKEAAGCSRVG